MKKKRPLSLEEQKKIRYDILVEVDAFCNLHNIRYSLAFGTLLGAVRHQGFIPWDDDLDIMMPLPDLLKLKETFRSENIELCDIDTQSNYRCAFPNFGDKSTFRKNGLVATFFGVGVDILPFIGVPNNEKEIDSFFTKAEQLQLKRTKYILWQSRFLKFLPIYNIPGYKKAIKDYRDHLFFDSLTYSEAQTFYVIALPLSSRKKCIFHQDLFDKMIDIPFEGKTFKSIENYDLFLTQIYGDYMKLPPLEERVEHHGQLYYRK